MEIQAEPHQQILVVTLAGSFDAVTAGQAQSYIATQLAGAQHQVVLDLSQVDFVSSSGVRVILEVLKQARQMGGDLRLAAAQPGPQRTLEISGMVRVLKTYPSIDEAVHSFESAEP
jgi:anti-anti-sigma factor